MSVVLETTQGDITVDLFLKERPKTCLNFLKLCKLKAYNMNLFHTIQADFIAQTGDPTGTGRGGESIFGQMYGPQARFFEAESVPRIRHTKPGLISMVNCGESVLGSQFFITLGEELDYLDGEHCVFGEVVEGEEVMSKINNTITDGTGRPYQDIRITHTVVLHDPYEDPPGLELREGSPEPTQEMLASSRIGADENINDYAGKSEEEINEIIADKEAKARATILEMVGDIPDADIAPPENVLFVCKLNPVTCDDDLEIIFSRFGPVVTCEVIKDRVSGDSLQYAFVEFADRAACEQAYFKMDNVLIDDRRIHVDFSQSVSKYRWKGKGRLEVLEDKKHEEKKKVDLKELINKERAEIKSRGDGKIERNAGNMQGKSREDMFRNRDEGHRRGGGREDRRREERSGREDRRREERSGREDRRREDRHGRGEEKVYDRDDRRGRDTREYRRDERGTRDDRSRERQGGRSRDGGDRKQREDDRLRSGDKVERRDKFAEEGNRYNRGRVRSRDDGDEYHRDKYRKHSDRREEDRPRARVDQFGRERVEKRRESSGSDSSLGNRRKSHKPEKPRRRKSSSSSSD